MRPKFDFERSFSCFWLAYGMRVVGKGSWKEREVGKSEIGKSQAKLERTARSWKEPVEVGKNGAKLERADRKWKVFLSWKVSPKLESFDAVGKFWPKIVTEVGKCHCP